MTAPVAVPYRQALNNDPVAGSTVRNRDKPGDDASGVRAA